MLFPPAPMFRSALLALSVSVSCAPALRADGPVLVEICESGVPRDHSWPTDPIVTERHSEEVFGLFELPHKYVSTGVRADRAFPTFVRASAKVRLPAGEHRLLLRSRGAARVFVDGRQVLATPFDQPRQFAVGNAGELPVEEQDTFIDLGPGYRFAPPGNREAVASVAFPEERPVQVVLETLIGGLQSSGKNAKPFRPELGETVIAVQLAGATSWHLLSPGQRSVPYTDAGWNAYESERRLRLDAINRAARAARRAEHASSGNPAGRPPPNGSARRAPKPCPTFPPVFPR